mmetsp:Transcript_4750/g.14323  ORF Transcript_4750/g.14323 Transcript_4750/m.14323 type:complete len:187 (+) Transcript_4750:1303-1863(+)
MVGSTRVGGLLASKLPELMRRALEDIEAAYQLGFKSYLEQCSWAEREIETLEQAVNSTDLRCQHRMCLDSRFEAYMDQLQSLSSMPNRQRDLLEGYYYGRRPFGRIDVDALKQARVDFRRQKIHLTSEWYAQTGMSLQVVGVEWHHVIPLFSSGPNVWFNLVPLRRQHHNVIHVFLRSSALFNDKQ